MGTKQRTVFVSFLAIVLLALAVAPSAAQEGPPQVGLRPDAPTYALHGPYWVGTRDFSVEGGREGPLLVHAWYPALNPAGASEDVAYKAVLKDESFAEPNVEIFGHALQDAAPDASGGPYPLVVFSPGFGEDAAMYAYLPEHYASQGFVVLAPEHQEMFDWDLTDFVPATFYRPRDTVLTLDYAQTLTAAGGALEGLIDMEHVAVAGHSYGGYTALAAAGARFDMNAYSARCEAGMAEGDELTEFMCNPLGMKTAQMQLAALMNLSSIPRRLWPSLGDSRVDAIIPMAGDSYMFDRAGLAEITVPVMAMGGTLDSMTPWEWGAHPTYQYVSSPTKVLVGFENGEHLIFETNLEDAPFLLGSDWEPYYVDAVWDKDRVHDLVRHLTTAFLLAELKGDADAAAALAPDAAQFPGVIYEAQGF